MSAMPTLRAHTLLVGGDDRPPVILVHGAANSGRVWTFWQDELARHGWSSHAIDLRGHGASAAADLGITRMADYADDVIAFARTLRQAPVLVGWSMGGLVAMMAAMLCNARACVGLAPSTPARAFDASVELRAGVFGRTSTGSPAAIPTISLRWQTSIATSVWWLSNRSAWNPAWHVMSARPASSSPPPRARCWSSPARPTRSGPGSGMTIFRSRPITSRLTASRIGVWF